MKVTDQKIEQCQAKSDVRYFLRDIYLDKQDADKPVLVATNGNILAVIPAIDADNDTEGFISAEALKAARRKECGSVTLNGAQDVLNGPSFPRPLTTDDGRPDAKYPDWRRVVPENPGKPDICLDAELVIRLARALCDVKGNAPKMLRLHLARTDSGEIDRTGAVYVEPDLSDPAEMGTFGVIMPCRVE